ncbi:hypothetical protein [Bacillus sp. CRN 9]|uniref:hypothetical protein n=1 Tax=Cytobacillus horneckiae TaxID=549687 RepID=UPI001561C096|nr:hypothetical protein [Bacillus sp. CRN 9]
MSSGKKLDVDKLVKAGVPKEMAEKIADGSQPSINTSATGGGGGSAVSLTYVDNYSTLLLVYTFLLHSMDKDPKNGSNQILNESLLATLQTAMQEQKQYRKSFLDAVNRLNQNPPL